MSTFKLATVLTAVVAYVAISHIALISPEYDNTYRQIAVAMLALPLIGIASWTVFVCLPRARFPFAFRLSLSSGIMISMLYATVLIWPAMLQRLDWFYLTQHVATNLLLAWFFGQTLIQKRTPLISAIATSIHGPLTEDISRYTRGVTAAWTIFFLAQIALSLLIFYFFSIETWSLFANILNWPLVILMFMGEYICRKIMNPDFQHASIRESISAYINARK